ncbi:MAG: helix-turn-helix domain-containing protein [Aristaeellaceae bacterium]
MPDKAVYTVADVARELRISKPTAYDIVHRQDFPKIMVGRCIRIPREAFLDWLNKEVNHAH